MNDFLDWLDRNLLALFLSFFGGIVFAARKREPTFFGWFCGTVIGTSAGIVVNMLMQDWSSLPPDTRLAIAFAVAANGPMALDWLAKIFTDKASQHINITPKKD